MNAVILAIDAGHIAEWVREAPRLTALNAMRAARQVTGNCKACDEPWPCWAILVARQVVRILDARRAMARRIRQVAS